MVQTSEAIQDAVGCSIAANVEARVNWTVLVLGAWTGQPVWNGGNVDR